MICPTAQEFEEAHAQKVSAKKFGLELTELMRWKQESPSLQGSQRDKALELVKLKRVVMCPEGFKVLPVEGYNKTTYSVKCLAGVWSCTCQHFVKNRTPCSHIFAVWLFCHQDWEQQTHV